jgi:SulP family sulfate permease
MRQDFCAQQLTLAFMGLREEQSITRDYKLGMLMAKSLHGKEMGAVMKEIRLLFGIPDWVSTVTWSTTRDDMFAAFTGATIVLPQGIAFAAIAGLPPEYGFYTAMITPIIAALFGSSWHTVSGPTTAISALVFAALAGGHTPGSPEFIQAVILLTFLVGIFQLILGIAHLGALVDFVSHSVMTGFITGAALLIGMSQMRHALGIDLPRPEHLGEFMTALWQRWPEANYESLLIAFTALAVGVLSKKILSRWPNYIIALLGGTVVYYFLGWTDLDVKTVGIIPSVVPNFAMPAFDFGQMRDLAAPAFAVAVVGLLEAMSISRAIGLRSGQDVDANREFTGQGMSNITGSFFNCYPGSASLTRSGINFEAGAKTPLSAIFAAVFLFIILLFVAQYFAFVPIPAMAGVIILVAWKLIDVKEIKHLIQTSKTETWIAGVTFFSSLVFDLEFAIYVGVLLSLALFLNKSSRPRIAVGAPDTSTPNRRFSSVERLNLPECPQLVMARIDGPLYFGSVEFVRRKLRTIEYEQPEQRHMMLIVKGIGEIDLPGAELLIEEATRRHKRGGSFHLQTTTPRTINKLGRFHVMKSLTKHHIHLSKGEAIAEIVPMLDEDICANCTARIFHECAGRPNNHLKKATDDTDSETLELNFDTKDISNDVDVNVDAKKD